MLNQLTFILFITSLLVVIAAAQEMAVVVFVVKIENQEFSYWYS